MACLKKGGRQEVREFGTMTGEIKELTKWLKEAGCEMAAMESTGVYWKPLYNLGCLLPAVVHAANIHGTKGGISTARRAYERYPSIQKFCADAGYRGTFVSDMMEQLGLDVDISEKIKPH